MITAVLASVCTLAGSAPFTVPDNGCTPGAYAAIRKPQVCTPRDRSSLPAEDRRVILRQYDEVGWSGRDGELDHRVPFFLGGLTVEDNVWPERGDIPNPKDRLEFYIYRRVCKSDPRPMRVSTARKIFLRDWRRSYRRYIK